MATGSTPMIITAGPCGGGSFGPADTMDPTGVTHIFRIIVRESDYVCSLTFDFLRNGLLESKRLGNPTELGTQAPEIILQPSEYITKIKGKIDKGVMGNNSIVRSLTIETNLQSHGPYGGSGGFDFELPTINTDTIRGEIIGFHGTVGGALDSIGAYIKVSKITGGIATENEVPYIGGSAIEGDDE